MNEDLPYFGAYNDFPITVGRPGGATTVDRVLRVWFGPAMVVHQNCEIEYADPQDSRIQVAPIVSRNLWPVGPWPQIEHRDLPAYMHLPGLDSDTARELGLEGPWPESAVALASTTCVSRGMVKPNRILSLTPAMTPVLQESIVRFSSVRGWGDDEALRSLTGKRIESVKLTPETVSGPAQLAKVTVSDDDGDTDEISVVWGVRRSVRPFDESAST